MQVAAIFLGVIACAAAVPGISHHGAPHDDHDGLTFSDVKALLETLESRKSDLFEKLSHVSTLCSVADVQVSNIQGLISVVQSTDVALNAIVQGYQAQMKALKHKADELDVANNGWDVRQDAIADVLTQQDTFLDGLQATNVEQTMALTQLTNSIGANENGLGIAEGLVQGQLLILLGNTALGVNIVLAGVVNERKCEYGFANLENGTASVSFQTEFQSVPEISLQIAGFNAHLDVSHYHDSGYNKPTNVFGLDKFVSDESATGFNVNLMDASQGEVVLKGAYCSWSACQLPA